MAGYRYEVHQHGKIICVLAIANRLLQQMVRWQIITAIDIVIEFMLVGLAAYLVHDLKMSLSRKSMVVLAFCFRLP